MFMQRCTDLVFLLNNSFQIKNKGTYNVWFSQKKHTMYGLITIKFEKLRANLVNK